MDKIELNGNKVVIRSVRALWPKLSTKSHNDKFELTIDLLADEAAPLLKYMKFEHGGYLKEHPGSADLPIRPFYKDPKNGKLRFELQNRQRKPQLLCVDGSPFTGEIGQNSLINLVAQLVPYTNPANKDTGVSLRVLAVQVIEIHSEDHSVRQLLGLAPLGQSANDDDDWDGEDRIDSAH